MITIKGLYFSELHKYDLREVNKPTIKNPNEVIVKITTTTICGSDIHIIDGVIPTKPGFVLGHEYVGIVEEIGSNVKKFKVGDRVIGPPAPYCGECINCKQGKVAHCINGGVHGSGETLGNIFGTHAEYTCVPHADSCLLKVPDNLDDKDVIFISDIASTGYTGINHAKLEAGQNLLIFGCGPVGLSALITAKSHKPGKIIVVEKSKKRLEKAMELGATHCIDAINDDVVKLVSNYTENKGGDVIIDAVGLPITIEQSLECATIGAHIFMVGIPAKPVNISPNFFYKNISFSMGLGNLTLIKDLLDKVEQGELDLTSLVTHEMPLDNIIEGIDMFKNKPDEVLKILIHP